MSILRELWKQRISSFVLMEDDVFICPNVYEKLDECQKKRHNCKLGNGATFNYFYHYQFSSFTNSSNEEHIDWHLQKIFAFDESAKLVNHLESESTLGHHNPEILLCEMSNLQ